MSTSKPVESQHAGSFHKLLSLFAFIFLVWMVLPAFSSMYVEAYVARLQSMAILLHRGVPLGFDDPNYPVNTEFLYLTRLGMVQLIRGGIALLGEASVWAVRLPVLLSFGVFAGSMVVFGRRWSNETRWALAAMIVLTPGILESSFFLADNLPSAALAALALALVTEKVSAPRWLSIGILMGCAVLIRLDAVLVAPMLLAVLWQACFNLRKVVVAAAYALVGAAVMLAVSAHFTGVSVFLSLRVGRLFSAANSGAIYQPHLARTLSIGLGFFGLISMPCVVLGVWENVRQRTVRWSLVMALMPGVFYLVFLPKANEIRDFCLLAAPFVVLQGATGLRRLAELARESKGLPTWFARAVLLFFLFVLFGPPAVRLRDGPRAVIGRAYSPIFWRQWQSRGGDALRTAGASVDAIPAGGRVLVVNSFFESDRYFHLMLLEKGYAPEPPSSDAACGSVETYRKGDTTVVSLRTENPYGLVNDGRTDSQVGALQWLTSMECLRGQSFSKITHITWGDNGLKIRPADYGGDVAIPSTGFPIKAVRRIEVPKLRTVEWTPEMLAESTMKAREMMAEPTPTPYTMPTYAGFHAKMMSRLWTPDGGAR